MQAPHLPSLLLPLPLVRVYASVAVMAIGRPSHRSEEKPPEARLDGQTLALPPVLSLVIGLVLCLGLAIASAPNALGQDSPDAAAAPTEAPAADVSPAEAPAADVSPSEEPLPAGSPRAAAIGQSGTFFTRDVTLQQRLAPVPDDLFVYKFGLSLWSNPPEPVKNIDDFDQVPTPNLRLQVDNHFIRSPSPRIRRMSWYANFSYQQNGLKGNTITLPSNTYTLEIEDDQTVDSASQEVIFDYRIIGAGLAYRFSMPNFFPARNDTRMRLGLGSHVWSRTTTEIISADLTRIALGWHLAAGLEYLPASFYGLALDFEHFSVDNVAAQFIGLSLLVNPIKANAALRARDQQ